MYKPAETTKESTSIKLVRDTLIKDSLIKDTLYRNNGTLNNRIIYLNNRYEEKKDSILSNDSSADLLFFSEYIKSYYDRYHPFGDSCKSK